MRHIIIQVESIMNYPPTLSLIKNLKARGDNICVLTSYKDIDAEEICTEIGADIFFTTVCYDIHKSAFQKMIDIPHINSELKNRVAELYDSSSIIWIMTSISLKYIGNILDDKRYIMYMYELAQEIRYYDSIPFLKVNLAKLLHNAQAVIECEYNRAHIVKAWFGLDKVPYVIPNKPMVGGEIRKNAQIHNEEAREKIKKIEKKKIIIYQGIIDAERPIVPLINAVNMMDDSYALLIMSSNIDQLKDYESEKIVLIPFIKPPYHLEVTSWAYIGVLMYTSVSGVKATSPLNSIYCAPNKLFEYSKFGIPMLGNDIPGLKTALEANKIGVCYSSNTPDEICRCVELIEEKYLEFSKNTKQFFEKSDTYAVIDQILHEIEVTRETEERYNE